MFLFLMGILFISLKVNCSEGVKIVKTDSPHCSLQRNTLKCDFEFQEEDVVVDSQSIDLTRNNVENIHIANAKKVIAQKVLCINVQFRNVHDIQLNNKACGHKKITLHFYDCNVNAVPRQLERLELVNSEADRIVCDMGLQKLLISRSKVTEFNVPWPQGGSYFMKIEHSVIEKFVSLNMEFQVLLHISNTTINNLGREGLTLGKDATLRITDSYINSRERGIVVKVGARVLVENSRGKLIIVGPMTEKDSAYDKSPPGVPQKVLIPSTIDEQEAIVPESTGFKETCKPQPYWHWLIPTVVATIEALVLIRMCGQKMPQRRKPSVQIDSESLGILKPGGNSSVNYYNENSKINLTRRR